MKDKTRAIEPVAEQRRESALSAASIGARGIQLQSFDEMWAFAKAAIASGLLPKDIQSPATALIIMQYGAELGLLPMAALRSIAVINGRPTVWGDMALALCRSSGVFDDRAFREWSEVTEDGPTAFCVVRRRPHGQPHTERFSMSDAIKARLDKKSGPWSDYPRRMLQMRARSWALRDQFGDVLGGLEVREEALDIPPDAPDTDGWASLGDTTDGTTRGRESGEEGEGEGTRGQAERAVDGEATMPEVREENGGQADNG